jgi:hypothetical protein
MAALVRIAPNLRTVLAAHIASRADWPQGVIRRIGRIRNGGLRCANPPYGLDAVSGGKEERHQVTLQEYERILAKMIADAKKK